MKALVTTLTAAALLGTGAVAGVAYVGHPATSAPASASSALTAADLTGDTDTAAGLALVAESTTTGLTDAQKAELDQFLAAHPKVAAALGKRLDAWAAFAKAHPDLVAELTKVAALPADQRKEELGAWLKAHPDDAKALHAFRQANREQRRQQLKDLREKRQERRDQRQGSTPSPSSPSTGSPSSTSAT